MVDAATLTAGATEYEVDQMQYSPNAPAGGVTGDLVAPTDTFGCTADTWTDVVARTAGRSRSISRGACAFADKAVNAAAAGSVGVVVYNNVPDVQLSGTLGSEGLVTIPVAGIRQADGQALAAGLPGPVTVTLDLVSHVETVESFRT